MSLPDLKTILASYGSLLGEIDTWFAGCQSSYPDEIRCNRGCSGCCRALFDITLLDALYLQQGFAGLPPALRASVLAKARQRLAEIRCQWPEFSPPYLLNHRPEEDWEKLMPEEDETPCVLLADAGHCLVYAHRPMTCRLHGLPLLDSGGEVMHAEWCSDNFPATNPLTLTGLSGAFDCWFREEVRLGRELTQLLYGQVIYERDTLIPAALLIDFTASELFAPE